MHCRTTKVRHEACVVLSSNTIHVLILYNKKNQIDEEKKESLSNKCIADQHSLTLNYKMHQDCKITRRFRFFFMYTIIHTSKYTHGGN